MHDWWLALAASFFGKIESLDKVTILYRQHEDNCLGAKRFRVAAGLKNRFKNQKALEEIRTKKRAQAAQFLRKYSDFMNPKQKELVHAFLRFQDSPRLSAFFLYLRYGFFKHGFFRNLSPR